MAQAGGIYELIDHSADIGVRVYGGSIAELFENAAFALFDVMFDTAGVEPVLEREFVCSSASIEDLLVEWLGNVLYVFDTEHIVFSRFRVTELHGTMLKACAEGAQYDPARHEVKTLVKAVTYHTLCVQHTQTGCTASVIFDI
jgi:SHS2 domain-containing protein